MPRWIKFLAIAWAATAIGAQQPKPLPDVYLFQPPQAVPALSVTTLDGHPVSLGSLRGKVVLLNFWATWCGPCRMEIPEFENLQRKYAGKLQVVGLSVDELPAPAVHAVAARLGINYPVALASAAVQQRFGGISTIPTTWVIDREGKLERIHHGAYPQPIFEAEVRTLLELPTATKVVRVAYSDVRAAQLSPYGTVGTLSIPGLEADLRALTPEQRQRALAALNNVACTCGCQWSLATCRTQDPHCGFSLPQARALVAAIKAGKAVPNR